MLLVAPVREDQRVPTNGAHRSTNLREWVNEVRSTIPAVTHVDWSARIQTVSPDVTPKFYAVIKAFEQLTGCGLIVNTSFNVRGEPIVCTPEEAYRCFMRTEMDSLVLESFLLTKDDQPAHGDDRAWTTQIPAD
jgi:carbamoyltransferase